MRKISLLTVLVLASTFQGVSAQEREPAPELRIDIPMALSPAKVVLNVARPDFEGDEPTSLSFLRVMMARYRAAHVKARIVAVFHGGAGYMLLGDARYAQVRKWEAGNPYKGQIADLTAMGVEFEECGKTMADNHWVNSDMLPAVKINAGANFRIVDLVQQGFVQLDP